MGSDVTDHLLIKFSVFVRYWRETGEWRKLHNEELHDLYSLLSTRIIRIIKARIGGEEERV
jgi:hypothetical protein